MQKYRVYKLIYSTWLILKGHYATTLRMFSCASYETIIMLEAPLFKALGRSF